MIASSINLRGELEGLLAGRREDANLEMDVDGAPHVPSGIGDLFMNMWDREYVNGFDAMNQWVSQ